MSKKFTLNLVQMGRSDAEIARKMKLVRSKVSFFCGSNLSRRTWHSSSKYSKVIWQCVKSAKKGKRFCPESKAIPEVVIEKAFVESYKILCENNQDILEDLLDKIEVILKDEKINYTKRCL